MKTFVEGDVCKLHANFSWNESIWKQNLCIPNIMTLKLMPWSSICMGIGHLFLFKSLFFLEDKILFLSLLVTFGERDVIKKTGVNLNI